MIGIYLEDGKLAQLLSPDITEETLNASLREVSCIVTYNGSCFDLPVIRRQLGVDLKKSHQHVDLKYACWKHNLRGGLKKVEQQLGISREEEVHGLDGRDACRLWDRYQSTGEGRFLTTLLEYNKADIVNLQVLEQKLEALNKVKG